MKKLLLFLLLALSLTAVISCDPPVEPEIPSEIKIDSKYLNLEFGAESVSPYRIPFTASHDWNCTIQYDGSNKDWLSLNQKVLQVQILWNYLYLNQIFAKFVQLEL